MALVPGSGRDGVAFLVSLGVAHEIMAKDVSSPQTAEINIGARAGTLMKWVHVGQVESAAMILIAASFDKKDRKMILYGGFLAIAINECLYLYAKKSGLQNPGPGTES